MYVNKQERSQGNILNYRHIEIVPNTKVAYDFGEMWHLEVLFNEMHLHKMANT